MNKQNAKYAALACGFCSIVASLHAAASPVISELFYDASGSDAGRAFVELFGTPGESLDGLRLAGINGSNGALYITVPLSGVIPADGIFVIGDDNSGATSVPNTDLIAEVDFQNGPDSVLLLFGDSVLDAVGYGAFSTLDVFAGEGSAAPDPSAGSSIARLNPASDHDDNGLDFVVLDAPTPGLAPMVSAVPLPSTAWLFVSGVVTLLGIRRKNVA